MIGRVVTDTSDFFSIDYGDCLKIGDKLYRIIGHAKEKRFGVEDPKFWVKRGIDLETRQLKIIKLVFHERFVTTLGGVKINCFRDPEKEGAILQLVKGHPYFMQGEAFRDEHKNSIRVLDVIRGRDFYVYLEGVDLDYETYYRTKLPRILKQLVKAFEAIRFLHINGYRHGDIRNDHLIIESETGKYMWIDFDYDYQAPENPFGLDLFGMGNILLYAIGKGFHVVYDITRRAGQYGDLLSRLNKGDMSILDKSRVMNLKKIYSCIPKKLNDILMHFSRATDIYYENVEEIIEDINRCLYLCFDD